MVGRVVAGRVVVIGRPPRRSKPKRWWAGGNGEEGFLQGGAAHRQSGERDARVHQGDNGPVGVAHEEGVRPVAFCAGFHHFAKRRHGIRHRGGEPQHPQADLADHGGQVVVDEHAAAVDDDDALGERLDLLQVVAGEYHRGTGLVLPAHRLPEGAAAIHVESGGRLVEEHQLRPADEGEGDAEPALLPAGERTGLATQQVGKPELLGQFGLGHRVLEVGADIVDHLAHPECRRQRGLLRGAAEPGAGAVVGRVAAQQLHRSGGRPSQSLDDRQQRRLSGAVRAEQADDAAGVDGEADIVEGDDVAEATADAVELDEVGHEGALGSDLGGLDGDLTITGLFQLVQMGEAG